jgi:hypothetical protein
MTHIFRCLLAAGLTVIATLTISLRAAPGSRDLESLLERYDHEPQGAVRDMLAARIDAAAHQKYATVSRLYWHTDLASARTAAREQGRPILHLRLLGKLDEDLSCANSRLFRATLYANQDVSRFLRERFILYWSSERPVPRVTIDYGDGRTLERTTAGNSAHYILDEEGNVLDVLPGLYAPLAFRRELERSLALAGQARGKSADQRAAVILAYHEDHLIGTTREWDRLLGTLASGRVRQLRRQAPFESPIAAAQRATMAKMRIELNDLRNIAPGLAPAALSESEVGAWAAAGRVLYGLSDPKSAPRVLDEASRALVIRLHNEVPLDLRASHQQLDRMIARLEETIWADSALNQFRLRPQIAREIVRRGGRTDFAALNAWIYSEVFRSPLGDQWLGLLPRNTFTGLPGDGVVRR